MSQSPIRLVDHLVLPVEDLATARTRYEQLGFLVAPDGRHSFGTENCCVNFANGTFIEPLAIGHRETVEEHERAGNMFLRRDMAYRFRHGPNGFSMLVLGGNDPKAERKSFQDAGYRTGELVRVVRPGVDVGLAFACDERASDFTAFCCERPNGPPKFDPAITSHPNGAVKICRVVAQEENPSDFQYYIQTVTGQRQTASNSFGVEFSLPNCEVELMTPIGVEAHYGEALIAAERGLRLVAFDVEVAELAIVQKLLAENSIKAKMIGPRLVVQPARGQGALIGFIEKSAS